jgi:hypothetical protein
MREARWITKSTDTNSDHLTPTVIHRHKCLVERATCYVFTYITCLVNCVCLLFALLLSTAKLSRGERSLYSYRSVVPRNLILLRAKELQWHGKTVLITIPMQFSGGFVFYFTSTVIKSKRLF